MKCLEVKLENTKIMLVQFAPGSSDPYLHGHGDEYQISIPLSGVPLIEYDGATHVMHGRKRLVTSPAERHRHFAEHEPGRVLLLNVHLSFLSEVLQESIGFRHIPEFATWMEDGSAELRKIAESIIRQSMYYASNSIEMQEREWTLVQQLLTRHQGTHTTLWRDKTVFLEHPLLQKALEFIHDCYTEEITLDVIANASGISKYHFLRSFREHIGCTPIHYLTRLRIQHGARMLEQSRADITTIALDAGFGSLSTFERIFKRYYGMSAREYRKHKTDKK